MKNSLGIASLLFLASVHAQEPEEWYNSICPSKDKQLDTIGGVQVNYYCEKIPKSSSNGSTVAWDPESCAKYCSETPGCNAARWAYQDEICEYYTYDGSDYEQEEDSLMIKLDDGSNPAPVQCEENFTTASCPQDNGRNRVLANSRMLISCGYSDNVWGYKQIDNTPSIYECMEKCDADSKCLSADRAKSNGVCILKDGGNSPTDLKKNSKWDTVYKL